MDNAFSLNNSVNENHEYDVEEIVGKRVVGKTIEYLVKWENYPPSENTWEPFGNLNNVLDLVEKYERKQKRHKKHTQVQEMLKKKRKRSISKEELSIDLTTEEDNYKRLPTKRSPESKSETKSRTSQSKDLLNPELQFLSNVDNLNVIAVKIINQKVFALITYEYMVKDQKIIKQDLIHTADLALIQPLKIIQFYESKLEFVKPEFSSLSDRSETISQISNNNN